MLPGLTIDEAADYYAFLRCKDLGTEDDSLLLRAEWEKNKKKGKFCTIFDRKRRAAFSPGKFHATSQGEFNLNRDFVKGSAAWNLKTGE